MSISDTIKGGGLVISVTWCQGWSEYCINWSPGHNSLQNLHKIVQTQTNKQKKHPVNNSGCLNMAYWWKIFRLDGLTGLREKAVVFYTLQQQYYNFFLWISQLVWKLRSDMIQHPMRARSLSQGLNSGSLMALGLEPSDLRLINPGP